MKTLQKLAAGVIILVILFSAASCGMFKDKESISADDFTEAMEDEDFTVEDSTEQFADEEVVEKCLIAYNDDYQIEFYVLESDREAVRAFSHNKDDFESTYGSSGSARSKSEVNIANYSKFAMTTGEGFFVVSRIDNTMIYLEVDKEFKDEVKDILESIGY